MQVCLHVPGMQAGSEAQRDRLWCVRVEMQAITLLNALGDVIRTPGSSTMWTHQVARSVRPCEDAIFHSQPYKDAQLPNDQMENHFDKQLASVHRAELQLVHMCMAASTP